MPFFILKNNNEIAFLIYDINDMNFKTWKIYLTTFFVNLIKNFNVINHMECEKLKIKFDKDTVYLNPLKSIDIIDKLQNIQKLSIGTKKLIKTARTATIRYHLNNNIISTSPNTFI